MNSKKKKKNSNLILVLGAIALIAVGLLIGVISLSGKKDNKPNQQTNLGEQQNQQTQSAVLQLASNLLGNANNLNQLTKKPGGGAKSIQEVEAEFLFSAFQPDQSPIGIGGTISPEVIERIWWELRPWIEEYLRNPDRSILDHAKEKFRRDVENWLKWQQREHNQQLEEYQKRLQELKRIEDLIAYYQKIREQELLDKISRKAELRNKGYVDRDLEYLKEKNLLDQEIPDLNAEKRIGATNALWIQGSGPSKIGGSSDLVIFLKSNNNRKTDINFSVRISENRDDYERVIRNYLVEKGKINSVDVYILFRTDSSIAGNSFGTAYYLAIHSLINRIPLPKNLGSTGNVQAQKVGAIGGLKQKIQYNIEKKNVNKEPIPIDTYITSIENKKYEGVPEQSYDDISPEITNKVKQIHFVSSTKEIQIALNEILNETVKDKKEHICGKEPIPEKKPEKPEPRGPPEKPEKPNSEITSEQLLSLVVEYYAREVPEDQREFKNKLMSACLENSDYQIAVSRALRLREEYFGKLEKLQSDPNQRSPNQEKIKELQAEIARLRKEMAETEERAKKLESGKLIQEAQKARAKAKRLEQEATQKEQELQNLLNNAPTSPSEKETEQKKKQLEKEYEKKFQEIASSVASLTSEILTNLTNKGYTIQEIKWTSELKAPSLTAELAVSFSLARKA